MPRLTLTALVALAAVAGTATAAQAPTFGLVHQWRAAVDDHQPGERDAVADAISAWAPDLLDDVADDLSRLRRLLDRARNDTLGPSSVVQDRGGSITVSDIGGLLGLSPSALDAFLAGTTTESQHVADEAANHVLTRGAALHLDFALLVPPGIRPSGA
jgi:hypothetical protein